MSKPRISDIDRNRLIDAYLFGKDYIDLADSLNVNQRSAYRIIQQYKQSGKREALRSGGPPKRKFTLAMVEEVVSFVERKPTATLEEIKRHVMDTYHITVSTTTITRYLDGELITLKLSRSVPFQWNFDAIKIERSDFAHWMMAEGVMKNLIYTDECGFNVWTARTQGRSLCGTRAVRLVEGQRGQNLTVCLAVSP